MAMLPPRFQILMVDDVTKYQRLYESAIVDAMPAEVTFAANGKEGLASLAQKPFDLLILDLNMPVMNGEEVLRTLRQDQKFDTMPVIILTGETAPETHRRLLELGADDFIEKGAEPAIFVARLRSQLRHRQALDRLARIAVDMDVFAAGVMHDIRNLEANITSICHLIIAELDEDAQKNRAAIMTDLDALTAQAHSLGSYAASIIKLVRDTTRALELKPQFTNKIITWCQSVLSPKSRATSTPMTINVQPNLANIMADEQFLKLAMFNILQNAIKYSRDDVPIVIDITQTVTPSQLTKGAPNLVVTRIRDHGIGVKPQDLRKIFEPFVRGEKTGGKGGFGLGLSLVTKVVRSMGGRVWAELPESGEGTVFCIELPEAKA